MSLIEVEQLEKRFRVRQAHAGRFGALRGLVSRGGREVAAVDDISFRVEAGEMVGYVGPNGAGKSTTIKMLTGILVPSGGRASVAGLVPWDARQRLAGRIGVVFGQRTQLWWDLPLIDSLDLLRHIYRVPPARYRENLRRFGELLDLGPFLDQPVRQLSLGQRMRGDLAAALLHDPPILYLDEPTIGLDVVAKQRVRDFLRELNREPGVTVLLTTHDMADIARLCERMMIIDHGRLLYDGGVAAIAERYRRAATADRGPRRGCGRAERAGCDTGTPRRRSPLALVPPRGDQCARPDRARHRALPIRDLMLEEPDIEEVVRRIYEEGMADRPLSVARHIPTADTKTSCSSTINMQPRPTHAQNALRLGRDAAIAAVAIGRQDRPDSPSPALPGFAPAPPGSPAGPGGQERVLSASDCRVLASPLLSHHHSNGGRWRRCRRAVAAR